MAQCLRRPVRPRTRHPRRPRAPGDAPRSAAHRAPARPARCPRPRTRPQRRRRRRLPEPAAPPSSRPPPTATWTYCAARPRSATTCCAAPLTPYRTRTPTLPRRVSPKVGDWEKGATDLVQHVRTGKCDAGPPRHRPRLHHRQPAQSRARLRRVRRLPRTRTESRAGRWTAAPALPTGMRPPTWLAVSSSRVARFTHEVAGAGVGATAILRA